MNDLELMYLLEENGYEASIENLIILKEELAQEANGPELEKADELDNEATLEKDPTELTSDIDNEDIYGDDEELAEDVGEVVVTEGVRAYYKTLTNGGYGFQNSDKSKSTNWKDLRNQVHNSGTVRAIEAKQRAKGDVAEIKADRAVTAQKFKDYKIGVKQDRWTAKNEHKDKVIAQGHAAGEAMAKQAGDKVSGATPTSWAGRQKAKFTSWRAKKGLLEDYFSDYELYQLLESNGYTTTEENLEILKEGLYNGKYEILDEARAQTKRDYEALLRGEKINDIERDSRARAYAFGKSTSRELSMLNKEHNNKILKKNLH